MNIALITGASSGLGREFARQITRAYPGLDELWLLSRSRQKLEHVQKTLAKTTALRIRLFAADLTDPEDRRRLEDALASEKPQIKLLVNAAGLGVIGSVAALPASPQLETIRTNCEALTAVTHLCLPYLKRGSHILQMASAFAPQPGFAVYAASKSYVLSFSRALGQELRPRGITVTAICPGPVETPFFDHAEKYHKRLPGKQAIMSDLHKVVTQAIRDAANGRALSVYGLPMKASCLACKVLPHSLIIRLMDTLNRNGHQ